MHYLPVFVEVATFLTEADDDLDDADDGWDDEVAYGLDDEVANSLDDTEVLLEAEKCGTVI